MPLLVHSDLSVVDEGLSVIPPSFLAFQGQDRYRRHPPDAPDPELRHRLYDGRQSGPPPVLLTVSGGCHARLVARTLCGGDGRGLVLPEATVLYRQHGLNALGSRGWRVVCRETIRRPFAWWRRSSMLFGQAVHQGCELARRVERQSRETAGSYPSLTTLREFRAAFGGTARPLSRLQAVRRHGIRPASLLPYPMCFYARVLLWTRPSVGGGPDFGNSTSTGARAGTWQRR